MICYLLFTLVTLCFPGSSAAKEFSCNVGDLGLIPGWGRSPGEGKGYPLQYSCLENPHGQSSLVGHSPWGHRVRQDRATKHSTARHCYIRYFSLNIGFFFLISPPSIYRFNLYALTSSSSMFYFNCCHASPSFLGRLTDSQNVFVSLTSAGLFFFFLLLQF